MTTAPDLPDDLIADAIGRAIFLRGLADETRPAYTMTTPVSSAEYEAWARDVLTAGYPLLRRRWMTEIGLGKPAPDAGGKPDRLGDLLARTVAPGGVHRYYLSTACLHGNHEYCGCETRPDGHPKHPARCKFCPALCICACHDPEVPT